MSRERLHRRKTPSLHRSRQTPKKEKVNIDDRRRGRNRQWTSGLTREEDCDSSLREHKKKKFGIGGVEWSAQERDWTKTEKDRRNHSLQGKDGELPPAASEWVNHSEKRDRRSTKEKLGGERWGNKTGGTTSTSRDGRSDEKEGGGNLARARQSTGTLGRNALKHRLGGRQEKTWSQKKKALWGAGEESEGALRTGERITLDVLGEKNCGREKAVPGK